MATGENELQFQVGQGQLIPFIKAEKALSLLRRSWVYRENWEEKNASHTR